jgi:hypothetical protein
MQLVESFFIKLISLNRQRDQDFMSLLESIREAFYRAL